MIVYGKRIFYYILETHLEIVNSIILSKNLDKKEFNKLLKFGKKIDKVDNKKAQALSKNSNHQGYFLDITFSPQEISYKDSKFVLMMDSITDVGNIGAIIRTAYSLGVDLIVITGIKDLKFDSIIRSSAGAAIDMPIKLANSILDEINELKMAGFKIVGADMNGEGSLSELNKVALIMGNEGEGINNRVKSKLDHTLSIDMKREFDSLNVSVAAGILIDRINSDLY
jgi:23S rRNA (guanosine2251-2'-O)-methyltransferase